MNLALKDIPHYTYMDRECWQDKWEIVDGVPTLMAPKPMITHQRVSFNINLELNNKICQNCLAIQEIDWKIDDDTVVSPDVLLVCGEDIGDKYLIKTPEIIFEILSPSTRRYDETLKFKLYEENLVKYYVLVDFEKKEAKVNILENGSYQTVAIFKDEIFNFEIDSCKIDFNFNKIWV